MLSPRDMAFISCRLLALYFFYSVIQGLPHAYSMHSSTIFFVMGDHEVVSGRTVSIYLQMAIQIVAELFPIVFFWFGAGWLSKRIYPARMASDLQETWDRRTVLSVVIVSIGLVMVLSNAAILAQWGVISLSVFESPYWSSAALTGLPGSLLSLVFGCLFILGAGTIARFVAGLRRW